jgi:hypothetical protein
LRLVARFKDSFRRRRVAPDEIRDLLLDRLRRGLYLVVFQWFESADDVRRVEPTVVIERVRRISLPRKQLGEGRMIPQSLLAREDTVFGRIQSGKDRRMDR